MKRSDAQPAAAPAVDGAKSITASLNQSRDEGLLYQEARAISTELCRSGLPSRKRVDRIRKTSCVWSLSRKQMSKAHTRTHIHTIRNNNRRKKKKKRTVRIFLKSHLSVSASERACGCVRVCTWWNMYERCSKSVLTITAILRPQIWVWLAASRRAVNSAFKLVSSPNLQRRDGTFSGRLGWDFSGSLVPKGPRLRLSRWRNQ